VRTLIINADDFGLHSAVNAAVEKSHLEGVVRSTSIMAVGEAFEEAVAISKRCPDLGIGIHLTLVAASPINNRECVPSLVSDDGMFLPGHPQFIRRYLAGGLDYGEVEKELESQIQKVIDAGICLTHADSHQHLHVLPEIGRIVRRLLKRFDIPAVRIPAEPLFFTGGLHASPGRIVGKSGLTFLARRFCTAAEKDGLRTTDHFYGMLAGGQMTLPRMLAVLEALPGGITELMVHPGCDNKVLSARYPWNYLWQEELQALVSRETLEYCLTHGIILESYRHCSI
jgi:hopanoid biosynthesis associated protein HpnK